MDRAALAHLRHELRTPLNHIIGYSEMLLEDVEGSARAGLAPPLRQIREEAKRLAERVGELLSFSRVGADAADVSGLPSELAVPAEQILRSGELLKRQAIDVGADDMLPDLERISRATEHLLMLAREGVTTPAASPGATVTAGALADDGVDAPAKSTEAGLILVVDDDDGNREMLARRLAGEGYRLHVAAGGREALEAVRVKRTDLVLLDVMMPDMDGYEVLQRLKADPVLRDIPVLMVSALDEIDSVIRCIELGAEDYLPKPFDPVLLRARIGACLEKKRLRDQEVRHVRELDEWNRTLEQRVREQVSQVERLGRLKRFFSPQLAELIVSGGADDPLRTHRREVTVVFLDLRGFTAFAETSEPEEVMGVLRAYHAEMGRLILEHEGTLERFTGDGMMIFFNDPVPVPDPAERAVRMAVAMRDRVSELSVTWRKRGYDLGLGIGIAQGYATIGAIGFEGRWDYGAIGTVTNLAARLCGEAKGGQVLVSSRLASAVEPLADLEDVGELVLKGLVKPVMTFNVVGLKDR